MVLSSLRCHVPSVGIPVIKLHVISQAHVSRESFAEISLRSKRRLGLPVLLVRVYIYIYIYIYIYVCVCVYSSVRCVKLCYIALSNFALTVKSKKFD